MPVLPPGPEPGAASWPCLGETPEPASWKEAHSSSGRQIVVRSSRSAVSGNAGKLMVQLLSQQAASHRGAVLGHTHPV